MMKPLEARPLASDVWRADDGTRRTVISTSTRIVAAAGPRGVADTWVVHWRNQRGMRLTASEPAWRAWIRKAALVSRRGRRLRVPRRYADRPRPGDAYRGNNGYIRRVLKGDDARGVYWLDPIRQRRQYSKIETWLSWAATAIKIAAAWRPLPVAKKAADDAPPARQVADEEILGCDVVVRLADGNYVVRLTNSARATLWRLARFALGHKVTVDPRPVKAGFEDTKPGC